MKKINHQFNLLILITLISTFALHGCAVAAIGAGVGAWKYGNSKKQEAMVKCKQAYNEYLHHMEEIEESKIMTLDEYCNE